MITEQRDVVVIGAGPAGCAAATVLGQWGRRPLILEQEKFPRYLVGESLLPYCYFPLKRIGMIDKLKASNFQKKYSVQFVNADGKQSQPFYFDRHLDHEAAQTWQVTRGRFDEMLLDNAVEHGAEVMQETKVNSLLRDGDAVTGVRAESRDGTVREFRAPVTIDASGRSAFSAGRQRWRVPDDELKKIAIWTYYRGAGRDEGLDEGATTVAYVEGKNWFWYIPLSDDLVSVGIVGERDYLYRDTRDSKEIFLREIKKNAWIRDHLEPGHPVDTFRVTGDFSYRSEYCADNGLVLVGDAFAFLDPVFSSGVLLALTSGELAADAVHQALNKGDISAANFQDYGKKMCSGIEAMRNLVYAFYDEGFSFRAVLQESPELHGDLTDCLIGHLDRDFSTLFGAVAKFATLPAPLSHGRIPLHGTERRGAGV